MSPRQTYLKKIDNKPKLRIYWLFKETFCTENAKHNIQISQISFYTTKIGDLASRNRGR